MEAQTANDLDGVVDLVADDLIAEFGARVPAPIVRRAVWESARSFDGARIYTYLPILLRREARNRLRSVAG